MLMINPLSFPVLSFTDTLSSRHACLNVSRNPNPPESSGGHEFPASGGIDFDTLNDETKSSLGRYGRSKLANILFAEALARRLANERVYVNIAHPGFVDTELGRHASDTFGNLVDKACQWTKGMVATTPKVGALTQLYLATSPEIENKDIRGRYFIPIAKRDSTKY